jgi:hypothetical protein
MPPWNIRVGDSKTNGKFIREYNDPKGHQSRTQQVKLGKFGSKSTNSHTIIMVDISIKLNFISQVTVVCNPSS